MRTISVGMVAACRLLVLHSILGPPQEVIAFVPSSVSRMERRAVVRLMPRAAVHVSREVTDDEGSLVLKEVRPILRFNTGSEEKIVNTYGLWCFAVTLLTCPIWMGVMMFLQWINRSFESFDPNRAIYDKTGKIWSKLWLTLTDSYPTISGDLEAIKESSNSGPCLYVANHASWLDIPVLCTVLDPVFKFIAKGELVAVPCIGQQLKGGNHILIDREDRRSQIRTFKEGITWLKKGVPIMAFPEGMRSRDGRLMSFKGGLFSMAVKTKVPIVPITICNTHAVMPANAVFPVQRGSNKLHVHVHSPIDTTDKTEAELELLVRTAFLSQLPKDQFPLPPSIIVESKEPSTNVVLTDAPLQHSHQIESSLNGHHTKPLSLDQSGAVDKSADALEVIP